MSKVGHGTHRMYSRGCRCDTCRVAERKYRNAVRSRTDFAAPEFPHGERRGYRAGCRCELCGKAQNIYDKALTAKRDFSSVDFPHGKVTGARQGCRCEACVAEKRKAERDRKRKRAASDPEYRERLRAQGRKSMSSPRAKKLHVASVSKRRALMLSTIENEELIRRIYLATPEGYTVDHIVALANGGKHIPENLQYLPPSINFAKHARIDYDVSMHAIRWQDVLEEPSTTISQESRPQARSKCLAPEMEMI